MTADKDIALFSPARRRVPKPADPATEPRYKLQRQERIERLCRELEAKPEKKPNPVVRTHGLSHTLAYKPWLGIVQHYPDLVCERWLCGENGKHPLALFFEDMGERPSRAHYLGRIDGKGMFCPGNCRWVTRL